MENDYISLETITNLSPTSTVTVEAWIKTNSAIGSAMQIFDRVETADGYGLNLNNTGKAQFGINGGTASATGTTDVDDGNWHHLTGTYDSTAGGATEVKVYVDGKLDGTADYSTAIDYSPEPRKQIGRLSTTNYFTGKIDQIRIYNYARTPAQVAYDYNRGGPVGWWKMDECQGTQVADWSGNANHGTLSIGASGTQNSVGTCSVGTSAAWTNGATGKLNSSINLDGLDDYIKVTSATGGILNPLDNLTLSTWVYWGGAGTGTPYIISKGWGDVYELTLSSGRPRLQIVNDWATGDYQQVIATTTLNQSQWYHLVGTYDKQKIKIYINGVLNNTADYTKSMKQASNPFKIGANHQGGEDYPNYPSYWHMFKGLIDDVRIYNYALTATQVKTLYNGGAVNFR